MSWKDKMKEIGGANLEFLSEDGEVIRFVVVGEPELLEGKYKGKPTRKIACPVITLDGYALFVIGMRLARRIAKHEKQFKTTAFMVARHGGTEDKGTRYELIELDDKETTAKLFEVAKVPISKEEIADTLSAAIDVMQG